jgi:hypothetical protein
LQKGVGQDRAAVAPGVWDSVVGHWDRMDCNNGSIPIPSQRLARLNCSAVKTTSGLCVPRPSYAVENRVCYTKVSGVTLDWQLELQGLRIFPLCVETPKSGPPGSAYKPLPSGSSYFASVACRAASRARLYITLPFSHRLVSWRCCTRQAKF